MAGIASLVRIDIVFDIESRQVLREVLNLFPVDGFEKGRFAGTVGTKYTIDVTTEQTKDGMVE